MEYVSLAVIGLVAGTLGSLMGLGGGIIIVPALMVFGSYSIILAGISPQVAVGTSIIILIVTGLSSTIAYIKQKKVDYRSGLIFFIGSGPGAIFGVWLNKDINTASFLIYFGLFIIFVSFLLMIRKHIPPLKLSLNGVRRSYIDDSGEIKEYGFQPILAIFISFVVGIVSGLFGVGGGSLMVPAMIILFGFPAHQAVATSMFLIFLSAIVGSISHISLGNVNWLYVLALIPGAWYGGKLGAFINQRLNNDTVVNILRIFLIIIGIRLIWQGIIG